MYESDDLVLFLGAGFSTLVDIPDSISFINQFQTKVNKEDTKYKSLFTQIMELAVYSSTEQNVDIESILSILKELTSDKGYLKAIVKLFSRYDKKTDELKMDSKHLKLLLTNFIKEKCKDYNKNSLKEKYGIFNTIEEYVRKKISRQRPSQDLIIKRRFAIFTTNYDTSIEDYFKDYSQNSLNDGFEQGDTRANFFVWKNPELNWAKGLRHGIWKHDYRRTPQILLFKLHGSILWHIDEREKIIHIPFWTKDLKNPLIYPAENLFNYSMSPFLEYYILLEQFLLHNKICVVIGYSFKDPMIPLIFHKALKINHGLKIILVKQDTETIKKKFAPFENRIIPISGRMGEDNSVTSNIRNELEKHWR